MTTHPRLSESTSLPHYTSTVSLPEYSPNLRHGERLLTQTLSGREPSRPTGAYVRRCGRETLVLFNQQPGVHSPVYGRGARVCGEIRIESPECISSVVLQMRGKMDVTLKNRGCTAMRTLRQNCVLWAYDPNCARCPARLPFSACLPTTFHGDDHAVYPLPPSYELILPGFFAKSAYRLCLVITRDDHKHQLLSSDNTMTVPFCYRPGSYVPRLPCRPRTFLRDIKTRPEEWRQVVIQIPTLPHADIEPLHLSLFFPKANEWGVRDTVPIHLQLTGPASLVQHFRVPHVPGLGTSQSIRCSLQRDIVIEMNHCQTTRRVVIGHGQITPCAPPTRAWHTDQNSGYTTTLDWDGELCCDADVIVGAFDAGLIEVQDFIVVEITPPRALLAQIAPVRHTVPIVLVAESAALSEGLYDGAPGVPSTEL
ncbi:hypothetical protein GGX14DRAFT_379642 [Mycena pura]|uniref:Uncharacterized protein n=1 Tax=Mycena pura TaxID=153505 RepID=A0AAD6Y213_9AGAR|nr:hypothetical protein GGX14DRAFT_379642 [Mycena pura]